MTLLFLLALALMGFVMKLIALLLSSRDRPPDWAFVLSPVLSPSTLRRARPWDAVTPLAGRAVLLLVASALFYAAYWALVRRFHFHGVSLSYLAIPGVQLLGETGLSLLRLLWLPGRRNRCPRLGCVLCQGRIAGQQANAAENHHGT